MKTVIDNLVFDTEKATLICKRYSQFMYKTAKGNFFFLHETYLQENDSLSRATEQEAKDFYGMCTMHKVSYEDTFNIIPEEA